MYGTDHNWFNSQISMMNLTNAIAERLIKDMEDDVSYERAEKWLKVFNRMFLREVQDCIKLKAERGELNVNPDSSHAGRGDRSGTDNDSVHGTDQQRTDERYKHIAGRDRDAQTQGGVPGEKSCKPGGRR